MTLEQLAEQTHLSKSALGSYEGDNFKDISHHVLIELAKFYEATVDYLLGRSQTAPHPVSPVSHASRYNTLHFASKEFLIVYIFSSLCFSEAAVSKGGVNQPFFARITDTRKSVIFDLPLI